MTDWWGDSSPGSSGGGGDWWGGGSGGASASTQEKASALLAAERGGESPRGQGLLGLSPNTVEHGGIGGFLQNAEGELAQTLVHVPTGLVQIGREAAHTFGPTGVKESITSAWNDPKGLGGGLLNPLYHQTLYDVGVGHLNERGTPTGYDTHFSQIGHREYKQPLNLPLDVLAAFTGGGAAALKGVKVLDAAGMVSREGRLAALADDSARAVKIGDETVPLRRGKTLQGRIVQDAADRVGAPGSRFERYPLVGQARKFSKAQEGLLRGDDLARWRKMQQANQVFSQLTPEEHFLLPTAAQFRLDPNDLAATPIEQHIKLLRDEPGVLPSAEREATIQALQKANPDVLANPRPVFVKAVNLGRELREGAAEARLATGELTREQMEHRDLLPMRVVSGARLGPSDTKVAYDAALQGVKDANKEVTKARRSLSSSRLRLAKQSGLGADYKELQTAADRMAKHGSVPVADRYAAYRQRVERLNRTPKSLEEFAAQGPGHLFERAAEKQRAAAENLASTDKFDEAGYRKPVASPAAEQAYRDSRDRMEATKQAAKAARKTLRETRKPGPDELETLRGGTSAVTLARMQREWLEGTREIPGLSRDFGPAYRFPHTLFDSGEKASGFARTDHVPLGKVRDDESSRFDAAKNFMAAHYTMHPSALLADYGRSMGLAHQLDMQHRLLDPYATPVVPGEGFNPAKERLYNPHAAKDARQLLENQAALRDKFGGPDTSDFARLAHHVIRPEHTEFTDTEKLAEQGLLKVPKWAADRYSREVHATSRQLRLYWDRPIDVWRYFTLNLRPGWATTNGVSNALMYGMGAGVNGPEAYLRALFEVKRGDPHIFETLSRWTGKNIRVPTLRRVWQDRIDAVRELVPVNQGGLFAKESHVTNKGRFLETTDGASEAVRLAKTKKVAMLPAKAVYKPVRAFGDAVTKFNIAYENTFRQAAFLEDALPKLRAWSQEAENANKSLQEGLQELYGGDRQAARANVQQAVDHTNRLMGDFADLGYFERAVIRRYFAPFLSWYKVVVTVSKNLLVDRPIRVLLVSQAAKSTANQDVAFPSFLQGALQHIPGLGPDTVISTAAANPWSTPAQIAGTGAVLSGLQPNQGGMTGPLAMSNPIIQSVYAGLSGTDPFTGGKDYAPGASKGPLAAALGYMLTNFPQYSYAQHIFGGDHIPGTDYAPIHQAYPSGTYPGQSRLDYALNYAGVPIKHVSRQHAALLAAQGK